MAIMVKNKITNLDIKNVYLNSNIDWEKFRNKVIYITGSTGVIGSFVIRCLLYANKQADLNIKVIAAVRDIVAAAEFFKNEKVDRKTFKLFKSDVINEIKYKGKVDFIIHAASNTSSSSFVEKPVETFNIAVKGTENILNFAKKKSAESIVYLSSMEVYGNINEPKLLKESELGTLDLNEARSSYPMGKRAAENLCYSYAKEYEVPVKVVRLAQVIGSNVAYDDSRVYAQFARSIVENRDIVLNTTAETTRSYCYITDVVTGILTVLTKGLNGECYNIANEESSYKICDIAKSLCEKYQSSKLIFNIKESSQYYKETHWVLDNTKLKSLGWKAEIKLKNAYGKLINSFLYQKYNAININKKISLKTKKYRPANSYTFAEQLFSIKNIDQNKVFRLAGIDIIKFKRVEYAGKYDNLPIEKNKIVFTNFNGNGYGCNPKYIAEEIIKRNLPYELCWLVNNIKEKEVNFPKTIRLIELNSKQSFKELTTAKIWIDNQRKIFPIKLGLQKKEGQLYIQTWHGSLGIKKLDNDVQNFTNKSNKIWIDRAKFDSQMTDYLLTNSKFETNILPEALWFKNKVLEIGHPRNDIFFKSEFEKKLIKKKIFNNLGISNNQNILLYVPSFRDDYRLDCYMLNIEIIKSTLENKFGGSWTILIRMHPRLKDTSCALFNYNKNVIDVSSYSDIQELLIAADIAISDYSSCIFDFILSKKPAFIFATDIEQFNTERGFYYPLESTPFPIATDNIELMNNIKDFNYEQYKQKVEEFLQEKGCIEDGHASERVVDLIEQVIEK